MTFKTSGGFLLPLCGWIGVGVAQIWGGWGLIFMLALGSVWTWGSHQKRRWLTNLCFVLVSFICMRALLNQTGEFYFISGLIGALVLWDLERFFHRLQGYERIHHKAVLIRRHMWRLGGVLILSLFLWGIANQIELELTFWYVVLLIGITLIGSHWVFRLFHLKKVPRQSGGDP